LIPARESTLIAANATSVRVRPVPDVEQPNQSAGSAKNAAIFTSNSEDLPHAQVTY
jgi:hypothetical protein